MSLEEKISRTLISCKESMPGVLVVALSGGRDSVCLLSVLKDLLPAGQLKAVHVNHHLRETADRDQQFCQELCREWNIPFSACQVYPAEYAAKMGISLEDAARRLRYQTLQKEADKGWIVTAHHQKDQAETLLLHLLRGSGLKGLSGMKVLGQGPSGCIIFRPMLEVTEEELDTYMTEYHLSHVEDETNRDLSYTRNRLRHELIPLLEQYNPRIVENLASTAGRLQEDSAWLEAEASRALEDCRAEEAGSPGLSCEKLLSLPGAIRNRVIFLYLEEKGLDRDLTSVHIRSILALAGGPSGKQISLPKGLTLMKSYDILTIYQCAFFQEADTKQLDVHFLSPGEAASVISRFREYIRPADSKEKWLCGDGVSEDVLWRFRQKGDYMWIRKADGSLGKKLLQDIMVDEKIPVSMRDSMPVLCDGSHVLLLQTGRISETVRLREKMDRVLYARLSF